MIAIIPARGGSKGLPGKNIKFLNGKPMIAYTIEAALNSKGISRVIVSTDDNEIAKIANKYGAEVPFMRPDFLATDDAKSIDVYSYTIERIEKEENIMINDFIILQPTSPLRETKHIDEAVELYRDKNADSVISFCKEDHCIFWNKFINNNLQFEDIFKGDYLKNRQEIRKTYRPNGAIYIFNKKILREENYYTKKSYAYIMERKYSLDIDTIEDFKLAQYFLTKINCQNNNNKL